MLHQHERHTVIHGHVSEEFFERSQSARRSADSDDKRCTSIKRHLRHLRSSRHLQNEYRRPSNALAANIAVRTPCQRGGVRTLNQAPFSKTPFPASCPSRLRTLAARRMEARCPRTVAESPRYGGKSSLMSMQSRPQANLRVGRSSIRHGTIRLRSRYQTRDRV